MRSEVAQAEYFPGREEHLVLQGRSNRHAWPGRGGLSLKSFSEGSAIYGVGRGRFRVEPGAYLLVNEDQPYSIEIDASQPVSSLCLFFRSGFAEDVQRSLTERLPNLLDCPEHPGHPVSFFERTYFATPEIVHACEAVAGIGGLSDLDTRMFRIVSLLLARHLNLAEEMSRIPAAKRATRDELYRRLHVAREYVSCCYAEPLSIRKLARVACLSSTHLLRSYRSLFGITPHQFLMHCRLQAAARLLKESGDSVTQICYAAGFESPGSFSSLFKRTFGTSPKDYRRIA